MGAGGYSAGLGGAGFDPGVESALPTAVAAETALKVDGLTKDNLLDENGRHVTAHWVDAAAFDLLRIPLKSIASAQEVGETISAIKYIEKDRIEAMVNDRVRLAWVPLLSRNLVTILKVEIDISVPGRLMTRVDYKNNLTGKTQPVSSTE